MCVLCVVNWELGKKTKKLATLEMEGGRRRNKEGCLSTQRCHAFQEKGGAVGSPN